MIREGLPEGFLLVISGALPMGTAVAGVFLKAWRQALAVNLGVTRDAGDKAEPVFAAELGKDADFELIDAGRARSEYEGLIGEYARHCGHADLLREQLDGVTGA